MRKLAFDRINGELRVVTDYFASLQALPTFRLVPGVKPGVRVAAGDEIIIVKIAGRDSIILTAPAGCEGVVNGLGDWGEDMAVPPSKVLLYIHADA